MHEPRRRMDALACVKAAPPLEQPLTQLGIPRLLGIHTRLHVGQNSCVVRITSTGDTSKAAHVSLGAHA